MKKILFTLILTLLGLASAQVFPDVPENHWARLAVDRTTRLGLITGFPDGTFRGTETITRYQAAMILYRLIQYIESNPSGPDPAALAAMNALLQSLEHEVGALRAKVAELDAEALRTADLEDLQTNLTKLRALVAAAEGLSPGDLERLAEALPQMREVLANYVALRNDVEELRARLDNADARHYELASRVDEAAQAMNRLVAALDALRAEDQALADRVERIERFLFTAGQDPVVTRSFLEGELDPLKKRLSDVETRLGRVEETLAPLSAAGAEAAPFLTGFSVAFGGLARGGAAIAFDVDRVGGLEGDRNPLTADYLGPDASAYLGLGYRLKKAEEQLAFGIDLAASPTASAGYDDFRFSGYLSYATPDSSLEARLEPDFRLSLTPYLLDSGTQGYPFGFHAAFGGSTAGLEAGYVLDTADRYAFAAFKGATPSLSARLGAAANADASTTIVFADLAYEQSGLRATATCHYPFGLADALACYTQAGLVTDFARLSASYRALGPAATPSNYFSAANYDEPYRIDQQGYGASARLDMNGFALEAAFEAYDLGGVPYRYLHAALALPVGSLLGLGAYYDAATENFGLVPSIPAESYGEDYRNVWGGYITFSGPADHPLLQGLHLRAGYEVDRALPDHYPYLEATYDALGTWGQAALVGRARGGQNWDYKFGLAAASSPANLPGQPSLEGRLAFSSAAAYGQETLWGLGLLLNELGIPDLSLRLRAGSYSTTGGGLPLQGATADRVLDATLPGLYVGVPVTSPWILYLGGELQFSGFRLSASRYAGDFNPSYAVRIDYSKEF